MILRRGPAGRPGPLVEECEAFLAGRFGEFMARTGERPPPWTWLNAITHADVGELARMAGRGSDPVRGGGGRDRWAEAASFLAAELLRVADEDPEAVHRLQLRALVPLELQWGSDSAKIGSPTELVREVCDALANDLRRARGRRDGRARGQT